jgi:hypothetical protein
MTKVVLYGMLNIIIGPLSSHSRLCKRFDPYIAS